MGQVLETYRFGAGPFQGSVDAAICLLSPEASRLHGTGESFPFPEMPSSSQWVHIFPESLVHQVYPPHETTMKYFHWGVSRIILESEELPYIVPMFHCGLQDVFPEDRKFLKYIPRSVVFPKFGRKRQFLKFAFGQHLDVSLFAKERELWKKLSVSDYDGPEARNLRSSVAATLRKSVEEVRLSLGLSEEDERLKNPQFWANVGENSGIKIAGKYGNSVEVIEKEG